MISGLVEAALGGIGNWAPDCRLLYRGNRLSSTARGLTESAPALPMVCPMGNVRERHFQRLYPGVGQGLVVVLTG